MSAHIVNDKTINRILSFLDEHDFNTPSLKDELLQLIPKDLEEDQSGTILLQYLGKEFIKLNWEGVTQRYEKLSDGENKLVDEYKFKFEKCDIFQAYQHLGCLTYQMMEGNVPETDLYKLLEKIETDLAVSIAWNICKEKNCEWEAKD